MCTVTFIPLNDRVFITHNRDEQKSRSKALPPANYIINDQTVLFPKDSKAGGSWIGINEKGHSAVLLNGAFHKHIQASSYRKSRGLIFLDILASHDLLQTFQNIDLENIEPFTLIIWDQHKLSECRWDASRKHISTPAPNKNHVWSSSTLYDEEVMVKRRKWYDDWQEKHPYPSVDDIVHFHHFGGNNDPINGLRMNRNSMMLTVSITQMEIIPDRCMMKYFDLHDGSVARQELAFVKAMAFNQ